MPMREREREREAERRGRRRKCMWSWKSSGSDDRIFFHLSVNVVLMTSSISLSTPQASLDTSEQNVRFFGKRTYRGKLKQSEKKNRLKWVSLLSILIVNTHRWEYRRQGNGKWMNEWFVHIEENLPYSYCFYLFSLSLSCSWSRFFLVTTFFSCCWWSRLIVCTLGFSFMKVNWMWRSMQKLVFFSTHNKCWYITFKEHIEEEEEEEGKKPCESQNVKTSRANQVSVEWLFRGERKLVARLSNEIFRSTPRQDSQSKVKRERSERTIQVRPWASNVWKRT